MDLLMVESQMMMGTGSPDNGGMVVRSLQGEADDHREVGLVTVTEMGMMMVTMTIR